MTAWKSLIPSLVAAPLGAALLAAGAPAGSAPGNALLLLWGTMLVTVGAGAGAAIAAFPAARGGGPGR